MFNTHIKTNETIWQGFIYIMLAMIILIYWFQSNLEPPDQVATCSTPRASVGLYAMQIMQSLYNQIIPTGSIYLSIRGGCHPRVG